MDGRALKEEAPATAVCSRGAAFYLDKTRPSIRHRATWRPGVRNHSGTCRCGARTDTGTRCDLWRVPFDYRIVAVIPLLTMTTVITWQLYKVIYVVNISLKVN